MKGITALTRVRNKLSCRKEKLDPVRLPRYENLDRYHLKCLIKSYENRKKILANFSFPCLRRKKGSDFPSGEIQYRARFETGDNIAVTSL